MDGIDWFAWHDGYDVPESAMARRLPVVRSRVHRALDRLPARPLRAISMCAGQGREFLSALASHPRGPDLEASLVELDPRNAAVAQRTSAELGLRRIRVRVADAGLTSNYLDIAPADLILLSGVFSNIPAREVKRTIEQCARLCSTDAIVIWSRHRDSPDLVPKICGWFVDQGFALLSLSTLVGNAALGAHSFAGPVRPAPPATRMFTFVGRGALTDRTR